LFLAVSALCHAGDLCSTYVHDGRAEAKATLIGGPFGQNKVAASATEPVLISRLIHAE
jgi:hypothetical protein